MKKVIAYLSYVDTGIVWVVDPWLCYKLSNSYNFAIVAFHVKHLFKNMKYLHVLGIVLGPRDSVYSVGARPTWPLSSWSLNFSEEKSHSTKDSLQ